MSSIVRFVVVTFLCMSCATVGARAPEVPPGLVAVSGGESVNLVEPGTGVVRSFPSGPVGRLFPAPGGILFAPDLVKGRTLVLDLRGPRVVEQLDAVTLPTFGGQDDRYVVALDNVTLLSYPERTAIAKVDAEIERPWQVIVTEDGRTVFILERRPGGEGGAVLTLVDLALRKVAIRAAAPADVRYMAFSQTLGLLAVANRSTGRVELLAPEALAPVFEVEVQGTPQDVGFSGDRLVVACSAQDGTGSLQSWRVKSGRKGFTLKKPTMIALEGSPVRLALAPGGEWAAVGLEQGQLILADYSHEVVVRVVELSSPPRDVVWCDPGLRAPLLPDWSDQGGGPEKVDLEGLAN